MKKKNPQLSFSVMCCKTWFRLIDNEISCVKEHLREIWLINADYFFIFYSSEITSNNSFNYLFNIVLYHNGFSF